jgi:hypothetical protein
MGRECRVASGGKVTDEEWKDYLRNQQPPEQDDSFPSFEDTRSNGRLIRLQAVWYSRVTTLLSPLTVHILTSQTDDCKLDVCQLFITRYSCPYA